MDQGEKGVLIISSVAVIARLHEKGTEDKENYIIEKLDDHHIFVDENKIDIVRQHIAEFMDKNSYQQKD